MFYFHGKIFSFDLHLSSIQLSVMYTLHLCRQNSDLEMVRKLFNKEKHHG